MTFRSALGVPAFVFLVFFMAVSISPAQTVAALCNPKVIADETVVTPQQRAVAGHKIEPPLIFPFDWPDTPIGVIKTGGGYEFFASDGGVHRNHKFGSVTRTLGTLDNPLGTTAPVDVTINANPDPTVNPNFPSYDYMGGGPVYPVPAGMPGAGNLLMVYHAEINTVTTQSFYAVLALAASTDNGLSWTDMGEIVRVNQAYRTDLDGYDIGDPPLVVTPDGKYFYIYFRDWLANGTTHWGSTVTLVSVARASVEGTLAAAFGNKPHAAPFQKFYAGSWQQEPGIGGFSTDLNPTAGYAGELQVAYNSDLQRYSMIIGEGAIFAYAESEDGLHWSSPVLIYQFNGQPNTYAMPVGMGDDPRILGKQFYIFYTLSDAGWPTATVGRMTVGCQ